MGSLRTCDQYKLHSGVWLQTSSRGAFSLQVVSVSLFAVKSFKLIQKWLAMQEKRNNPNKPKNIRRFKIQLLHQPFLGEETLHHCRKKRRRQWHPTQVLLPGKSHGRRSLVGCSPWGREELDTTSLSLFTFMHWRRKWQPTPVFLPGECWGWRSLVGCHLWGRTESDTTEATQQQQQQQGENSRDRKREVKDPQRLFYKLFPFFSVESSSRVSQMYCS